MSLQFFGYFAREVRPGTHSDYVKSATFQGSKGLERFMMILFVTQFNPGWNISHAVQGFKCLYASISCCIRDNGLSALSMKGLTRRSTDIDAIG